MEIPIIIDFEASGFGRGSYPIEVGFAAADGGGWCSLIKPEPDWLHWDLEAAAVHHISRDLLMQAGRSAAVVAESLNEMLNRCIVYSDAWFHDYVWMGRLFDVAGYVPSFQLKDLRQIITPEQEALWDATKAEVLLDLRLIRHRASTDAKILQLTWLRTREPVPVDL